MKILKQGTSLLKNADGKLLKVRPDEYIYPDPDAFIFTIETTNTNELFRLPLFNGSGYNFSFDVDWGDETSSVVTSFADTDKEHTYPIIGEYVIRITAGSTTTGKCQGFRFNNIAPEKNMITRVISWGIADFRELDFYGCRALISLPEQAGKLSGLVNFSNFCRDCSALKAIPYGIFFNNITAATASYMFTNCASIRTIRADLFQGNTALVNLAYLFQGCIGIKVLPSKLFYNCKNINNLSYLAQGCSTLDTIPFDLFERDTLLSPTAIVDLANAFDNCIKLTIIQPNTFSTSSIRISNMYRTFYNCSLLTTFSDGEFANQVNINSLYETFAYSKITSVPTNFFKDATSAVATATVNASYMFYNCTSLTVVNQSALEGCTKINLISYMFSNDLALLEVKSDVFKNCPNITTAQRTFFSCPLTTGIAEDLFDTNNGANNLISTMEYCFYGHRLPSFPVLLLRYCSVLTNMNYTFNASTSASPALQCPIKFIPTDFLKYCVGLTSANGTFSYMRNLVDETVNLVFIPAIPDELFRYNISLGSIIGIFSSCSSLTRIPDYLFKYNSALLDVSNAFASNSALLAIPENLFRGLTDDTNEITTFTGCFSGCANIINRTGNINIPENLFKWSNKANTFSSTFAQCNKIEEITPNLFKYNPLVTSMSGVFSNCILLNTIPSNVFNTNNGSPNSISSLSVAFIGCTALTSIPTGLLDLCANLTNVYGMFNGCTILASAPSELFANNLLISGAGISNGFAQTFMNCYKLQIPSDIFYAPANRDTRFLNKNVTFYRCFYRNSYTGTVAGTAPDLWLANFGSGIKEPTQCFGGTANNATSITNYLDIPDAWKL